MNNYFSFFQLYSSFFFKINLYQDIYLISLFKNNNGCKLFNIIREFVLNIPYESWVTESLVTNTTNGVFLLCGLKHGAAQVIRVEYLHPAPLGLV